MASFRSILLASAMLALAQLLVACSSTGRVVADRSATVGVAEDPARGSGTTPSDGNRLDQWTVHAARPANDTDYSFNNIARGGVLFYAAGMPNGLNWDAYTHNEWSFRKSPSSSFLAIYNRSVDRYLAAGSNVVRWSSSPAYEWSWSATTNRRIALRNAVKNDYLVSDVHSVPFGQVNWKFRPVKVPPAPTTHEATVTMTAQPPVQGYVPFLGTFGGGPGNNGVLVEVRNPQQFNVPLFFVKPGYSSSQCNQGSATLYLAPGAALSAGQMTTLWGAPEPSLGTQRPFLACAATNNSVVFVNVKYRSP